MFFVKKRRNVENFSKNYNNKKKNSEILLWATDKKRKYWKWQVFTNFYCFTWAVLDRSS